MNYKDLNVYKRAYKVAIDLHHFLEANPKIPSHLLNRLQTMSREVLANIAESSAQRTTKAKRFFNFKARDLIRLIQMDLDFLHDIKLLPEDSYTLFYNEYEVCSKQLFKLNQSFLEKQEVKVAVAA